MKVAGLNIVLKQEEEPKRTERLSTNSSAVYFGFPVRWMETSKGEGP
jgi:hypothetical protein